MKRRDMRVVRGKHKYGFSAGEVVEALQAAGVMTDDAIRIAREVERHFLHKNSPRIPLKALLARLEAEVRERVGSEVAARFAAQTPPFVPLTLERASGAEPFSRRTLTASLEKLDLSFKEAYAVAHQVEQGLRADGLETVSERELAHRVALALETRYGRDVRLRYEAAVKQSTELVVVEEDGLELPYSRGILAQSLMAVGLGPELSHNLAKRVEDALWQRGEHRLERAVVRREVVRLLDQEAGEEFARRYELMRSVRRPERPIVLLIGGAAGVGKSAVASELGYRLGIPRIVSTDSVRQALRSLISAELSPVLHSSSYAAWKAELLPSERAGAKAKRKRVVRGFQAQVQQLGTAIAAIIDRNIAEATSLVMEGTHLVPGIVPLEDVQDATVIELVFSVKDEERHKKHFAAREGKTGRRRPSEAYLQHLREIRILQRFVVERAERAGVPVIEASDFDRAVEKAIEYILDVLLAENAHRERTPAPGGCNDDRVAGSGSAESIGAAS